VETGGYSRYRHRIEKIGGKDVCLDGPSGRVYRTRKKEIIVNKYTCTDVLY